MEEENKNNSGFWTGFGKFSAVIIAIGTLIGIVQFISSQVNNVKINYSLNMISHHKSPEKAKPTSYSSYVTNEITISDFVLDKGEYRSEFRHYLILNITNVGKKIAEGLAVNFPFNGVYYLVYHDGSVDKGNFTKQIKIGSLKINEKFEIYIWTNAYISSIEKINYAYNTGSGKIHYPINIYNPFLKFILEEKAFFVFFLILCIIIIFIISLVITFIINKKIEAYSKNQEGNKFNTELCQHELNNQSDILESDNNCNI